MSWILGFLGASLVPSRRARLASLHPAAQAIHAGDGGYLAAGGLAETCHTGTAPDGTAWAVVGLGLQQHADHCTFLDAAAWQARLTAPTPPFGDLDGHFVAVRWRGGRAEAFTDALGLRTLYVTPLPDGTAFSTRLDWLAALRGGADVNLAALGGHWLVFNQLSYDALAQGIQRLGPGGRAVLGPSAPVLTQQPWTPDVAPDDHAGTAFARTLAAFVHPRPADGSALSLGLSGGLDSRLLLALRLDDPSAATHVFGAPGHPDVRIAQQIAADEGVPQRHFDAPVPDAEGCLHLLRTHVAQTQAVSPASAVLGLRHYAALRTTHPLMIDGGMGEASRRQFMNRLLRRGRAALRSGDAAALLPFLRIARADVFTAEATAVMEIGARAQLAAQWEALPPLDAIGAENAVDLLGVRTRLPNFFGFDQNRLEGILCNYMPFAQPSVLRAAFRVPLAWRRNGRLFRHLIRARHPSLTRYPLVKSGVPYPFALPTLPAFAWTKARTLLGHGFHDDTRQHFLRVMRPFALEAVHSHTVRTFAPYDDARLVRLVEGYYSGQEASAAAVDWWLAFEVWRRVLAGEA